MTDNEIKDWCYQVWPKHWLKQAPSSNSRALFVKETIKLKPTEEDLRKWEGDIIAQTKYWRDKSKIEKVYGIPRLSQWMKDRRFDDIFIEESAMDLQAKADAKYCVICGNETHGPRFDKCQICLHQFHGDTWKQHRKDALEAIGLLPKESESQGDWATRCREYLLRNGKSGQLVNKMTSLKHL